jgi:hypothetical protein
MQGACTYTDNGQDDEQLARYQDRAFTCDVHRWISAITRTGISFDHGEDEGHRTCLPE